MCRVARGYGQDVRTVKSGLLAPDVYTMSRHLPELQREEAELFAAVFVREIMKAAVDLLEVCGVLRRKSDEVTREALQGKAPEEIEAEAHKRANRLIRSMTLKGRPKK